MATPIEATVPTTRTEPASRPDPLEARSEREADRDAGKITEFAPEQAREAIDSFGDTIQFGGRTLKFSFDEDFGRVVITVSTGEPADEEVVRQIPPQEFVHLVSKFRELFGLLVDETV